MIIRVIKEDIDSCGCVPYEHPLDKAIGRAVKRDDVGITLDSNGKLVVVFPNVDGTYTHYRLPKRAWKFYDDYLWDELEPNKKKPKPFSF